MTRTLLSAIGCLLAGSAIGVGAARADDGKPSPPTQPNLVQQANAPIATVFQVRLQDGYTPQFNGVEGKANAFSMAVTMPLPEYRLLPFPQLSVLTIPAAIKLPNSPSGFGDIRFVDIVVIDAGHKFVFGVGPSFVFPTASERETGQGKWQVGPAAAIAFAPEGGWLVGVLAQNPISFAGSRDRRGTSELILQPFVTYQFGEGWFIRSQPQLTFDWKTHETVLPLDLGFGRVIKVAGQNISCFVDVSRNLSRDEPAPRYGVAIGVSLLYPNIWR